MFMDHKDCVSGTLATEIPLGGLVKIGGVDAYLAKPEQETKLAVVIASDVFGFSLPNTRLIADEFAKAGFLCVLPDLFEGKPLSQDVMKIFEGSPSGFFGTIGHYASIASTVATEGIPFFWNHSSPEKKFPIINAVLDELRANYGITKIGIQGYCYGGKICVGFACTDKISAFATAHPSMVSVPVDIEKIRIPSLWCCAEEDQMFPPSSRKQAEMVLEKKQIPYKFIDYPGTKHGFAVRGNSTEEKTASAARDAIEQSVAWFKEYLNKD